jgi:GT2 family glycosyltransferase
VLSATLGKVFVPRLSIVIPLWGNLKQLEDTLVSVLQNRPDDCEVIVALDQVYDDPYDLADEVHFVQAPIGAGLAASINLGVASARSPVVHLLMCGVEVEEGWADPALDHFEDPQVAVVAPVVLDSASRGRIVTAGIAYQPGGRLALLGRGRPAEAADAFREQIQAAALAAGFYRRSVLEEAGLFSETVGDWLVTLDMALSLHEAGYQTVLETECRVYAATATARRVGIFRQSLDLERLYWRWAPQEGWLGSLAAHGWTVVGETLAHIPRLTMPAQLTGRLVGLCGKSPDRRGSRTNGCHEDGNGRAGCQAVEAHSPHFRNETARPVAH